MFNISEFNFYVAIFDLCQLATVTPESSAGDYTNLCIALWAAYH